MKLRNKKTGEIVELQSITLFTHPSGNWNGSYKSLKELNERFEDYTTAEPLIKDKKIRKAVRAWAEASGIDQNEIKISIGQRCTTFIGWIEGTYGGFSIDFQNSSKLGQFTDGAKTTIEELCGEEE